MLNSSAITDCLENKDISQSTASGSQKELIKAVAEISVESFFDNRNISKGINEEISLSDISKYS